MKLVELEPPALMSEDDKRLLLAELQELMEDVRAGKVESFFGAWSYGHIGTCGLRVGSQGLKLVGRIEWLKQRMIAEMM